MVCFGLVRPTTLCRQSHVDSPCGHCRWLTYPLPARQRLKGDRKIIIIMSNTYLWYQTLIKPTWAPPAWIFGPVWTVLYIIIAISFGFIFYQVYRRKLSWAVALPFGLNLVFNLLFTPIQFGLQNNLLASVDIILVLITLATALWLVRRRAKWVALVNLPYLAWVSFATVLQLTVTYLNWG